jgi:hypothetical protein
MLQKKSLFELVKSLDTHEKRYLVTKSKKGNEEESAYGILLKALDDMQIYSDELFKELIGTISNSAQSDVKKHYLYHWILKHLVDYQGRNYSEQQDLIKIQLLIDRSMVHQAGLLIPELKNKLKTTEKYASLISLLEMELKIQQYSIQDHSEIIFEELNYYASKYTELKKLEALKHRFRKIIDQNMFSRTEVDEMKIKTLFENPILKRGLNSDSFLINFNYNLLYYWKSANENNWKDAYKYAFRNYQFLERKPELVQNFQEVAPQIIYNFLNAASINQKNIYKKGLKKLNELSHIVRNERLKNDIDFYAKVSVLIHFNWNRISQSNFRQIQEAYKFIQLNKGKFSKIKLNNFYFELAKTFFYLKDFKKAFLLLNEIYQNLNVSGHTLDFYTHSRILFCLACFEIGETDLMVNTAKSAAEFLRRNKIFFRFEKRMISFITRDLSSKDSQKKSNEIDKFLKLQADLNLIFKSGYEANVLNYFDYVSWLSEKIIVKYN